MTTKKKIFTPYWKINTHNFTKEILENLAPEHSGIMMQPMNIFRSILAEVGQRASELNDPKLNALMCRLSIYSISDPSCIDFDSKLTNQIIQSGMKGKHPK